jgi:hypothetical protein
MIFAAQRPFDDFDVNAVGTLNLLEAVRRFCAETPFVSMSTNKGLRRRVRDNTHAYDVCSAFMGDHICYISNLRRFRADYPDWELSMSLDDIFADFAETVTVAGG